MNFHTYKNDLVAGASTGMPSTRSTYTSSLLNNRGVVHHRLGDLNAAMECYEKSLRMRPTAVEGQEQEYQSEGEEAADEASDTWNSAYEGFGCSEAILAEQEPEGDDAVDSDSSLIGMDYFSRPLRLRVTQKGLNQDGQDPAAITLFNISLVKMRLGQLETAKNLLDLALTDSDKNGEASPRLRMMFLTNLGYICYRLGKYDDAAQHFDEASALPSLFVQEHCDALLFERDSRSVESFLRCLIAARLNAGRARDALGHHDEALALVREASEAGTALDSLSSVDEGARAGWDPSGATYVEAVVRHHRKEYGRAEELHRRYLERQVATSGRMGRRVAPRAAAALHGMGCALFERRRLREATGPLLAALGIRMRYLGEEHMESIDSLYAIGRVLHDREELADALEVYERTVRLQREVLGKRHVDTLRTLSNIAKVHQSCGRGLEAMETCMNATKMAMAVLGPSHPFVLYMLVMKGMMLHELGLQKLALATFESVVMTVNDPQLKVEDLLATCRSQCCSERAPGAAAA